MSKMVNNWEAAEELQRFKSMYIDELKVAMDKPKNAQHRDILEGKLINFSRLHSSMLKLVAQHEDLVDELTVLYQEWFTGVSANGVQRKEMLQLQAEILQRIFDRLHKILEPLDLPLGKTKDIP